ncbi:Uncharacterised protein [Vibrio cholerae]|nr:Uncharacterised protein [Vibrio cholerae]
MLAFDQLFEAAWSPVTFFIDHLLRNVIISRTCAKIFESLFGLA